MADQKKKSDRALGAALTLAARMHRARSAELLAGVGLYPGQEQTLQYLAAHQAPTMGELADALNVKAPTVSKTIARLTQQSLVERQAGGDDARQVRVMLTQAGRDRAASLGDIDARVEEEMTKSLDGKDRKRLRRLLRKATKNLSKASGRGLSAVDDADDEDGAPDASDITGKP